MARILAADDDHASLELLKRFIKMSGRNIEDWVFASNLSEISKQLENPHLEVALLDVHMNGSSTVDLVMDFRKNNQSHNPLFYAYSGMDFEFLDGAEIYDRCIPKCGNLEEVINICVDALADKAMETERENHGSQKL